MPQSSAPSALALPACRSRRRRRAAPSPARRSVVKFGYSKPGDEHAEPAVDVARHHVVRRPAQRPRRLEDRELVLAPCRRSRSRTARRRSTVCRDTRRSDRNRRRRRHRTAPARPTGRRRDRRRARDGCTPAASVPARRRRHRQRSDNERAATQNQRSRIEGANHGRNLFPIEFGATTATLS